MVNNAVESGSESDTGSVTADVLDADEYKSDRIHHSLNASQALASMPVALTTNKPSADSTGQLRLEAASLFDARYKPIGAQQVLLGPAPRRRKPSTTDRTPTASSFSLTPKPKLAVALSPRSIESAGVTAAAQPHSEYAFAEAGSSSPTQLASPWDAPQYIHPLPLEALPLDSIALDRAGNHTYKSKLFRSPSSSSSASTSSDKIAKHTRRQDPERRRLHNTRQLRNNGVDNGSSNGPRHTQITSQQNPGRKSGSLSGRVVDSPQCSDDDLCDNDHSRQLPPCTAPQANSEDPSGSLYASQSAAPPASSRANRTLSYRSRNSTTQPDRLAARLSDLHVGPLSDARHDDMSLQMSADASEHAQRPSRHATHHLRGSPAAIKASESIPIPSTAQHSPTAWQPQQADSTSSVAAPRMPLLQTGHSPYPLLSTADRISAIPLRAKDDSRRRKTEHSKLPFGRAALHDTPNTSSDDGATFKSCRAYPIGTAALVERIKERRQHDYEGRPLLLLDLRPLQEYIANHGSGQASGGSRIRQSINVNFPSLLIKRFRKGNVTAFNLESFITTTHGQQLHKRYCPASGDVFCPLTANVDICILDEQISQKEFANLETTASVGAVLVSVLQKRRQAALDAQGDDACDCSKAKCELWYHDGTMLQLLDFARSVHPGLVANGSDDLDDEMPLSPPATRSGHSISPPAEVQAGHSVQARLPFVKSSSDLKRTRTPPTLSLPTKSLSLPPLSSTEGSSPLLPPLTQGAGGTHFHPPSASRTKKPSLLAKLDTSDQIRLPQLNKAQKTAPAVEGQTTKKPQNSLAPARSFQEMALAQSTTPTRSAFARAAGLQPIHPGKPTVRGDEYENIPPTPAFGGSFQPHDHGRSMSTDSTASNSQYPAFGDGVAPNILQNGWEHQDTANNDAVVPFSVSVIIPGFLYLGPEPVRQSDVEQLEAHGIKRILNMAVECETQERWSGRFEKIATIPMRDSLAEVHVQDRIREACVLLDDADLHGKPTYVHCKAGKSRSVTIVLAYLIHRNHWPLKRAYSHVSDRRHGVCPNIGFVAELMRFEENELGSKSQGVLGSGDTPEPAGKTRNGYFRAHSKTLSNTSFATDTPLYPAARNSPDYPLHSPATARSASRDSLPSPGGASYIPTSLEGRPSIVRHLSLIASSAMNLTADQAGSKGVKEAKMAARSARVRDSLPPNVSFGGWFTTANTPLGSPSIS